MLRKQLLNNLVICTPKITACRSLDIQINNQSIYLAVNKLITDKTTYYLIVEQSHIMNDLGNLLVIFICFI